jgi:hypothetical protein
VSLSLPIATAGLVYSFSNGMRATPSLFERAQLQASVLFSVIAIAAVLAPLSGVAAISAARASAGGHGLRGGLRGTWSETWPLITGATLFVLSAVACGLALGASNNFSPAIVTSHATLWACTVSLCMLGLYCGVTFADPLDAAAVAIGVSAIAASGVFVVGPLIEGAPTALVNAALLLSPFAATAASGGIDLVRTGLLYRVSPLAHMNFDYPAWHDAFLCYTLLALAGFFALAVNRRRRVDFRDERTSL